MAAATDELEGLKERMRGERERVPHLHEDAVKREEVVSSREEREVKDAVEQPRHLPPYEVEGDVAERSLTENRDALVYLKKFEEISAKSAPRPPKPRSLRSRYKRYQTALAAFKESRVQTRVTKLQKVVAAGLATEHDYHQELLRLNLDPADYPLLFTPSPYRAETAQNTLREYIAKMGAVGGESEDDPEYRKVEYLISEDQEAREEWVGIQEQVSYVLSNCRKTHSGDLAPLKSPFHHEAIRNIHARRSSFFSTHQADPLSPQQLSLINDSTHGRLHAHFFTTPLLPPHPTPPEDLDPILNLATLSTFASRIRTAYSNAAEKDVIHTPHARTRLEWLTNAKSDKTWADKKQALTELVTLKEQREAAAAPDYELVYTTGDMGIKPDEQGFSLHPSSSIEYSLDKTVT